jgi:hypothetical protein
MASKTPFEIRSDLLAMAKDYMDRQYELQWETAQTVINKLNSEAADYAEKVQEFTPKPYTVGEIIDKANEFYSFVTKK